MAGIARARILEPKVLLLDEATSAGVSREWGDDDMEGTIGRSIVDWGKADAMGVAVDCDRG